MNPLQWAQNNIFYTDEQKRKINQAASVNSGAYSMMKPGVTYGDPTYSQQQKTDAINAGVSSALGLDKTPTTVIGPGGPGGFGNGGDQSKNTVKTKNTKDTKNTNTFDNKAEINARLEQQKKERAAALAKTKGDYDHSSGGYTGEREIFTPEDTRKNGLDIVQKGRNLGRRSFGDLLNAVAPVPYSSNQLPLTDSSPFTTPIKQSAPIDREYPDFGGEAALRYDSETGRAAASARDLTDIPASMWTNGGLSERKAAGYTSISPEDPIYAEAFGQEKADLDKKRGQMSNRLSDALSGVQDQEVNREITPERRQQMASMAFLNTKGSMAGLKARDRVNNVVYAAGQHYGEGINPNDGDIGDKFKIDRKDARGIADGSFSAQELLGRYTKDISETSKDTPAQNQAPLTEAGNAVRDQFAPAKESDFELNNGDMRNTMPGKKTIDSSFMESVNFSDPAQLAEYNRRMKLLR